MSIERSNKKNLIKDDSCFRLDNINDIQNTFNKYLAQASGENALLEQLSVNCSQRDSMPTSSDIYRTPMKNRYQNDGISNDSDGLSQISEYTGSQNNIEQPKEKPKKRLNLIIKNGQLIKVGEEQLKNNETKLTSQHMNQLEQYIKRTFSSHSNKLKSTTTTTANKRNSELSRKDRCVSLDNAKNVEQFDIKECSQMNELVESYGEVLISTICQTMIVNNINEMRGSDVNSSFFSSVSSTTGHISSKIMKEFGISTAALSQFETFEEKRQYIIEKMNQVLQGLLSNFKSKLKERERQSKQSEEKMSSKGFKDRNDPHYLDWLKIESEYEGLNLKLKEMVVASVNQYENQVRIIEKMKEKGAKINDLANYVGINTGILLQKEKQQQIDPSNLLNKMINKGREHYEWIKQIEEVIKDMKWDEEEEEKFKQSCRESKKQQANTIKLTNGQNVGFSENIYKKMKEEMHDAENREYLLDKLQDGQTIGSREIEFIANTSRLLNKCVDKLYEQQKANTLHKDLIDNIELKIAENIISQYSKIKKGLSILRNEYLQHKAINDSIKIHTNRENEISRKMSEQNQKYHKRMTKVFRSYLYLRQKKDSSNIDDLTYSQKILVKAFSQKLKMKRAFSAASTGSQKKLIDNSINLSKFQLKTEAKDISLILDNNYFNINRTPSPLKNHQQVFQQENISSKKEKFIPRVGMIKSKSLNNRIKSSQHHAPSKLFAYEDHLKQNKGVLRDNSDIRGFKRFYDSKKYDVKQQEQYEIKLLDHPHIKNKLQFIQFYSKGPGKLLEEREKNQQMDINRVSNRQYKAIVLIQKYIRGFLAKIKLKHMKQQKIWDLQYRLNYPNKRHTQKNKMIQQNSVSTLQGSSAQLLQFKKVDSQASLKRPYFVLDNKIRDSILETNESGDIVNQSSKQIAFQMRQKRSNSVEKSLNRSILIQHTPLHETTTSMQNIPKNTNQTLSYKHKVQQGMSNRLSEESIQKIKTNLLRQRLGSIIRQGDQEMKKQMKKLNKDLKNLEKSGDGEIYKTLKSNSSSPSSSTERKSESKIDKKRMQQRRQALFRGVLNNDLNYLSLVGHRWEKNDFNQKDKHLNTPIYYACKRGNVQMIKWLFSQGSDINIICQDGNTPLHFIFGLNDLDLIQFILKEEERINLNARNNQGQTPLALCRLDILQKLGMEKGITVVVSNNQRLKFNNNQLLKQKNAVTVEQQLMEEQSSLTFQNFILTDQKSNFNHINSQRFFKKKSNISIKSSLIQNFSIQPKVDNY